MNIKLATKLGQNGYKECIYSILVFSLQEVMSWVFITLKKLIVFPVQIVSDGRCVL